MKKLLVFGLLFAGIALAADISSNTMAVYTEPGAPGASPTSYPRTATQGIVLNVKGKPVQYVNVTVQPVWDGGAGFLIDGVTVRAWKYTPQGVCAFDGGPGCITNWDAGVAFAWSRVPAMDFSWKTDSGTPYVTNGPGGVTFSTGIGAAAGNPATAPSLNGGRLFYQVDSLTTVDAGAQVNARVILEGLY